MINLQRNRAVSRVGGDAAFDFRARQRFLEHLVAHIDSLQAYFMYRVFHSRQILTDRLGVALGLLPELTWKQEPTLPAASGVMWLDISGGLMGTF
jgi:hypothetical protein